MDAVGQCLVEMEDNVILCSRDVLLVEDNPVNQVVSLPIIQNKLKENKSLLLQEVQVDSARHSLLDQNVLNGIRAINQPDVINYSAK